MKRLFLSFLLFGIWSGSPSEKNIANYKTGFLWVKIHSMKSSTTREPMTKSERCKKAASTCTRRPEKFRTPQDLNPDLCNAVAVSHQLSYRAMGLFQAFLPFLIKNCDKHVKLVIGTTYHPSTYPWSTRWVSFLLDITVFWSVSRLNS